METQKGLDPGPQMAPEILEGYLSYRRVPPVSVGSQAQARLSSPDNQSKEEVTTKHLAMKSSKVSVHWEETGVHWRHRHLLKRPAHKTLFRAIHPGLQQREGRVDSSSTRRDWGSWLQKRAGGTAATTTYAESLSLNADAIFVGWSDGVLPYIKIGLMESKSSTLWTPPPPQTRRACAL